MENTSSRIAKNTIALYVRSFITMLISLYTSRVILNVLGVEDYGIYNVVGGVVVFFTVLDSAMNAACQRFLNFEMGKNNEEGVREVFCSSINIQAIISIIIPLITEILGLILLFNYMTIPVERMTAAFWVFQCSVITMAVNTMSIPYNAMIIAKEKMTAFAYIDILNTSFKLLSVLILPLLNWDKLILYAIFMLIIQVGTRYMYTAYCNKNFSEARYRYHWNKDIMKQMLSFSFWTVFSSVASMLLTQGLNILYNIFYGVVANAAMGIGNQVLMAVRRLTGNMTMSFAPQIVKRYSSGEYDKVALIWSIGSKCTVWLFALFTFPIVLNVDTILELWLKNIPANTSLFVALFLVENLIRCFTGNTTAIVRATGRIRNYELITNGIRVSFFGLVVLVFFFTKDMALPLFIYITNTVVQLFYNVYIGCRCIGYSIRKYLLNNGLLLLIILIASFVMSRLLIPGSTTFGTLIINALFDVLILSVMFFVLGFLPKERAYLKQVLVGLRIENINIYAC